MPLLFIMSILIKYPWIAGAVAAAFGALWHFRRRRIVAIAAIVWALYGAYEYLMHTRVLCSGECNIRIDLLLVYPVLLLLTVAALFSAAKR